MNFSGMISLALMIVLSMGVAAQVRADSEMPLADYMKETETGQYIFVMLAQDRLDIRRE